MITKPHERLRRENVKGRIKDSVQSLKNKMQPLKKTLIEAKNKSINEGRVDVKKPCESLRKERVKGQLLKSVETIKSETQPIKNKLIMAKNKSINQGRVEEPLKDAVQTPPLSSQEPMDEPVKKSFPWWIWLVIAFIGYKLLKRKK